MQAEDLYGMYNDDAYGHGAGFPAVMPAHLCLSERLIMIFSVNVTFGLCHK